MCSSNSRCAGALPASDGLAGLGPRCAGGGMDDHGRGGAGRGVRNGDRHAVGQHDLLCVVGGSQGSHGRRSTSQWRWEDAGAIAAGADPADTEGGRTQSSIGVLPDGDLGQHESLEAHVLARVQKQNTREDEGTIRRSSNSLAQVRRCRSHHYGDECDETLAFS